MLLVAAPPTTRTSSPSTTTTAMMMSARRRTMSMGSSAFVRATKSRGTRGSAGRRRAPSTVRVVSEGTGRFIVGGNWKCNGTRASVKELVETLNKNVPNIEKNCDVFCCPTFLHLPYVKENLDSRFNVCAQNSWVEADLVDPEHHYDSTTGAFTGEISAEMLEDLEVPFVLLGHSERRTLLGETDEIVGKKVAHARYHGLSVVVCIGESLEERENGTTFDVIFKQLKAVAKEIDDREHSSWGSSVVIAYEPIWAIGTGKVATPEQVQEVHSKIRNWLAENVSEDVAKATRIQYGGSVNASNCADLAKLSDIDGFLVGGASLNGDDFAAICNASSVHYKAVGR